MKVSIVVNPVFIGGGWSPADTRVGGTEECVINWAKHLSRRGHEVQVFHNGQHGVFGNVRYRQRLDYLSEAGAGVTLNVNYPDLRALEPTVYWSTLDQEAGHDLSDYCAVGVISQWAYAHTGVKHKNIEILPPGYDSVQIYPGSKIPKTVLYASSPDRGLEQLVEAWPTVIRSHPDATLLVTYGAQVDLPSTLCLGEVDESTMTELYRTSDVWCHPANGYELYCMTGVKAQAAGCVPVYFPTMALTETVKAGIPTTPDDLAQALIDILGDEDLKSGIRAHLKDEKFPDWESTTDQLEQILLKLTR